MEERFVVEAQLDESSAQAFARVHIGQRYIFRCAIGILWLLLAAINWSWYHLAAVPVAMLLIAAYYFYSAIFWDRILGKRILKDANSAAGRGRYGFAEDCVHARDAIEDNRLAYNAFVDIVESDAYFFLYINKSSAHILPKSGFVKGDPAEFAAFIAERTGLTVRSRRRRT